MNILFFQNYLHPSMGGVERVTYQLSSFFEMKGEKCFHAFLSDDGLNCFPDDRKIQIHPERGLSELKNRIVPYVRENGINVIIIQDRSEDIFIHLREELRSGGLKVKLIGVLHISPEYELLKHYSIRRRIRQIGVWLLYGFYRPVKERALVARNVDKYVVLSPTYAKLVRRIFSLYHRIEVHSIPNPLSFSMAPLPEWKSKLKQILIVARLEDSIKNVSSALRIWKSFEAYNSEYNLVIAGIGPDEQQLKDYSNHLGLRRVSFLGLVTRPQTLYMQSQFLMMTSRCEGWGMTLVESMQFGCVPIVMKNSSATNMIVRNNISGYVVTQGDENAFLKALLRLVSDMSIAEKMSENGYFSVQKYDIENIGSRWLELMYS